MIIPLTRPIVPDIPTYRDPDDTPCLPARAPLWPGQPAWIRAEMTSEGLPEEEPSAAQARYIRALGGEVPISKGEAGLLLTQLIRAKRRAG